jgi:hypothetical protein
LHFIFPQILSQTEANSRFKERATLELAGWKWYNTWCIKHRLTVVY